MLQAGVFSLTRRSALAGAAVLGLPFVARPALAAPVRWVLYTVRTRGSAGAAIWQAMAERVKTASNGALEITVVTAGRIGIDANAISQGVSTGAIMMGDDSYFGQLLLPGGVARLPLLVPDRVAMRRGSKAMKAFLKEQYAQRNAVALAYTYTPRLHTFGRVKFDNFAGLANRRVRVVSPEQGEFVRRLGAVPVSVPTADVGRALGAGEIDAVFSFAVSGGTVWRKQLKGGYVAGPHSFDAALIANKSGFEALAKPLQELLMAEAARAETAMNDTLLAREDEAVAKLAGDGLELGEQQTDDVRTVSGKMSAMWDDWARVRGLAAQDLLFAFRRAMEAE